MTYSRGDVVLIPFPFTDLSAKKTRPAVVVSSVHYHSVRSELLLTYVSSQIAKADAGLDHVLIDWASAGLPRPSFVRPKLAAIESTLVVHHVGRLSTRDMVEVDHRLWQALGLLDTIIDVISRKIDLRTQSPQQLQLLAETALNAIKSMDAADRANIDVMYLHALLMTFSKQ